MQRTQVLYHGLQGCDQALTFLTSYYSPFAHYTPATFCFSNRKLIPAFVLLMPSAWNILSPFSRDWLLLAIQILETLLLPVRVANQSFVLLFLILCLAFAMS